MAILEIIKFPNPILKKNAEPVTEFSDALKQLAVDMAETMYDAPGSGLAANQVGVLRQIVVVDIPGAPPDQRLIVLVNPEIVVAEGAVTDEEGCLSVVDYTANVTRAQRIRVKAQDLDGSPLEFDAEDWYARIIQHEIDHLRGKLFIDRISSLKRNLYTRKRKKQLREEGLG